MAVPSNYDELQRRRREYKVTAPRAAVTVQAAVRRMQAQARVASIAREQREREATLEGAALVLQARERGNAERRQLRRQAEHAEKTRAATAIQSAWRSKYLRLSQIARLDALRAASFDRRRKVLKNDEEDARRRRVEVDARLAVLEEEAAQAKITTAEHHRRAQLNKVKREHERNAKRLALEAERQRQALRERARSTVGARDARIAEEIERKEQEDMIAEQFLAQEEAAQRRELDKRLKSSLDATADHEVAAQEEYAIANERREDREALAYLCMELSGTADAMTGVGVGELFRALDPEGYGPEQLPEILKQMGAKVMLPAKGTPQRRRIKTGDAVKVEVASISRQSNDGSHLAVTLDRLFKWWDKSGSEKIANLLQIRSGHRLAAAAVLEYVRKFRSSERENAAAVHCQRVWRGKRARLVTMPLLEQRRADVRAEAEAAEKEAAAHREKEAHQELQRRHTAALSIQTSIRVFLAVLHVKRKRQQATYARKQAIEKTESKRQAQRRLIGPSDYEKRVDAAGGRVVPRRGSGADVFNLDDQGQVVESTWPKNWMRCCDQATGKLYWYNHRTYESRWNAPPELAGMRPTNARARYAHEDESWTKRQNYKARTASVTAVMYGSRQPRYERARILRRVRNPARPHSSPPARRVAAGVAVRARGSESAVIDRRSTAASMQPWQEESTDRRSPELHPHRPADTRSANVGRSQRPHSATSARATTAARSHRPQSAPYTTSDRSTTQPHAAMRRAHINQLCQPKAIANVLRLQSEGAQYEAHPPRVKQSSAERIRDSINPVPQSSHQHHSSESRRRPHSARAAVRVHPPLLNARLQQRPKSATVGQTPSPTRGAISVGQGPSEPSFPSSSAPINTMATPTTTGPIPSDESSLRLEERISKAAACEDYLLAEKLQARADAMRKHPGQSPQARSPRLLRPL